MNLLKGKTAIVTGASRGIGRAIATCFAQNGANVACVDLVYDDNAKSLETELNAMGVKCITYASDVANYDKSQKTVEQIANEFGRIDVLVNNAGITKDGALKRMTEEQWDAVIAVNLKSIFNFTKAVQPIMWKQGSGSIINLSSVVGVAGNVNQANYSASKAGIIGFTKSIAKEFGVRGIRCNTLAPGFIVTEMTRQLPEEIVKGWYEKIPLKRGGKPEEVAQSALFLASELSSYISGQVLNVCGAMQT